MMATKTDTPPRSHDELVIDVLLLKESELFDAAFYRTSAGLAPEIDAAEHYLLEGWRIGLEPGPNFEGNFLYPYFRSAGSDGPPAITCIRLQAAGWLVYPTRAAAEACAGVLRGSELFDGRRYAARAGCPEYLDPALHYVIIGEPAGLVPSERFDPFYYREVYSDIRQAGLNSLAHYLSNGRSEGRRPVSAAGRLTIDASRLDPRLETVLLICHEATRTGAPILAYNIATRLRSRYNVVVLFLAGGDLVRDFAECTAAVVGPLSYSEWNVADANRIVSRLLESFPVRFVIANSVDKMEPFVRALASALVPVVTLVNEFPSTISPKTAMEEVFDWSTQLVFSAKLTADAAVGEYPTMVNQNIHILPQGRCDLPRAPGPTVRAVGLPHKFRPKGFENALVVLGCGTVIIRKGVDVFLSCAAAVTAINPGRPVRFVWIGRGYDPEGDALYSSYLAEQILRSQLGAAVTILPEVADLGEAYELTDILFISSRLDPLPNVGIDAVALGIPVVCFEGATGMAEILRRDAETRRCVVPYLDARAAALVIAQLADDDDLRRRVGQAARRLAGTVFDMNAYVRRLEELGREAVTIMEQRKLDLRTLIDNPQFDEQFFCLPDTAVVGRETAIKHFLGRWASVGVSPGGANKFHFRRPSAGFHPQIYAREHAHALDGHTVNPLADYIRRGRPDGPWTHEVIRPHAADEGRPARLRAAIHGHFYYPELADDFMCKLAANRSRCDLLLSTDEEAKAGRLVEATAGYERGLVTIRVVPNRGRDIGPFFSAYAAEINRHYDVVGHLHGKQSLSTAGGTLMGEFWREFLWQNLVGDLYPMMDLILDRFATDETLGLVFPDDPHLPDWDVNLEASSQLAARMGLATPLPPFFDFPVGTMFWARPRALAPMFGLKLEWGDYPEEPLPSDGTILHTLERLLPFAAKHAGYRYATTHVPGVTW